MSQEKDILKIKSYDIYLERIIGRGEFGIVYECKDYFNPQLKLCAKIINQNLDDPKIKRETELMKMIMRSAKANQNIVGVEYVEFNEERIVFIKEKFEYDLEDLIYQKKRKENKNFTPSEALNVLKQVVNGYKSFYSNNVIHKDLQPANIKVLEGTYKIGGIGKDDYFEQLSQRLGANTYIIGSQVGFRYMAPEQRLEEYDISNQSNIFSLGIITYELIFGELPYIANNNMQIRKAFRNLEKNPVQVDRSLEGMTNEFADLIEQMLKVKENQRISWESLFKHPLIQVLQKLLLMMKTKMKMKKILNNNNNKIPKNKINLHHNFNLHHYNFHKLQFNFNNLLNFNKINFPLLFLIFMIKINTNQLQII